MRAPAEDIVADDGPLLEHIRQTRTATPDINIEMVLTGGGSKDKVLSELLVKKIENHPDLLGIMLERKDHTNQSLVSEGGICLLLDPAISEEQKVSKRSYGVVMSELYDDNNPQHRARKREALPMQPNMREGGYEGKLEIPKCVTWLTRMNERVRQTKQFEVMADILELMEDYPSKHIIIPLGFPMDSTRSAQLSRENGISSESVGIDREQDFSFEMSVEDLASLGSARSEAVNGFVRYADKDGNVITPWQLEFAYRFCFYWAGMLQFIEIQVPHGGVFPKDRNLGYKEMHVERFQLTGDCAFADEQDEMNIDSAKENLRATRRPTKRTSTTLGKRRRSCAEDTL